MKHLQRTPTSAKELGECSQFEIVEFERLLRQSGEVQQNGITERIRAAFRLAFVNCSGATAAIGAIKRPSKNYREGVFKKAGLDIDSCLFEYEVGWIFVEPANRGKGLANKILDCLTPELNSKYAYATSRANNVPMHAALKRHNFNATGTPFPSRLKDQNIQLFLFSK